jgi:hypothetical protein
MRQLEMHKPSTNGSERKTKSSDLFTSGRASQIPNHTGWHVLTYDTTFQIVSWTSQENLLDLDLLLWRHLFICLPGGVSATQRNGGEDRDGLFVAMTERGCKSRTSCKSVDAEGARKEENGGGEGRRGES